MCIYKVNKYVFPVTRPTKEHTVVSSIFSSRQNQIEKISSKTNNCLLLNKHHGGTIMLLKYNSRAVLSMTGFTGRVSWEQ
jgi:hypothetical protein